MLPKRFITPEGKQIDKVVPFRITKLAKGYRLIGRSVYFEPSLYEIECLAKRICQAIWPYYKGKVYIIEE